MEQRTEEWFKARLGKVTASRVKDVMAKGKSGPSVTRQNYMMELVCQRLTGKIEEGFTTQAMRRGVELEPVARSAYEVELGVLVEECGLIDHPIIEWFGASPDGLVLTDGAIEIKCPNTAQHVWCLRNQRPLPEYEWQMTAQLACTGREWVDFISYDDRLPEDLQYFRKRFTREEAKIDVMEAEVTKFLEELQELINELTRKAA